MTVCRTYKKLMAEKLAGEISEQNAARLEQHLQRCSKCAEAYASMLDTLDVMQRKPRPEMEPEFWDSYYARLKARMAREESAEASITTLSRRKIFNLHWSPAFTIATVAAVFIFGIVIGRFVMMPGLAPSHRTVAPTQEAFSAQAIDYRTSQYFEKSKVLLLGLVNADTDEFQNGDNVLTQQRTTSQNLIREASFLKENLSTTRQRRLKNLISELEIILLEIANLEEQADVPGIEMIKSSIERKGILMKINIQEMNARLLESTDQKELSDRTNRSRI